MPRKRAFELLVLAAGIALVALLGGLRATRDAARYSAPSTYDTGAKGYAALYELLSREGVRTARFEFPIGELGGSGATLVLAGDGALAAAAPSASALHVLDGWVRRGGALVVLDGAVSRAARRALGLPALHRFPPGELARAGCAFVPALRGAAVAGSFTGGYPSACTRLRASLFSGAFASGMLYRRGSGTIALASTASVFDNLHLAQRANARVALALFGGRPVFFDERVHGHAAGRSFWEVLPWAMRAAIVIALAAALLAIIGANLPFAPPYDASPPEERDSGAYIISLARMLQRGGAAQEAIARITRRCELALGSRTAGDERARMLLRELRTLEAEPRPGARELLQAGRIFARMRKDYEC